MSEGSRSRPDPSGHRRENIDHGRDEPTEELAPKLVERVSALRALEDNRTWAGG
jgi:hypothetical protein